MSWLREKKTGWRAANLALLLVSILGPWWFDRISVPAEYECTSAIRLEGDFCGIPMAGAWILIWVVAVPINILRDLITGAASLAYFRGESLRSILVSLFLVILLLPFFNTLYFFLPGENLRRRVFTIAVWGLAAAAGLWFGLSSYPRLFTVLWGVWLYTALAVCALILELLLVFQKK